nr:glutamate receptor 1.2-like [Ipomoea batatas]
MVPKMFSESAILATLADKARVPLLSFSSIPSPKGHPFFVQISEDEGTEFMGIAAFIKHRRGKVILIYEDTDDGRNSVLFLGNTLQHTNARVIYKIAISPLSRDLEVIEELAKIIRIKQSIFIVHLSPSLASLLFLNANRLGMISEGYVWILTSKSMNFLHSLDVKVVELMQGLIGFKSYIPASSKLENFTLRWRRKSGEVNVHGIWAYDAIWALSMAVEKLGSRNGILDGDSILNEILRCRFTGLGGEFQLVNGKLMSKTYEIMNVIEKGFKRVGFWRLDEGFSKSIDPLMVERHELSTIISPRLSSTTRKGWPDQIKPAKLRVGIPVNARFKQFTRTSVDHETGIVAATGFSLDVFLEAMKLIEVSVPYEFISYSVENSSGTTDGSYTDILKQVQIGDGIWEDESCEDKYDAVVGDTTITSDRSSLVDFTLPYTDLGVGTVARREKQGMWYFLKPMGADLWIMITTSFILVGATVWLIEHKTNEQFQGSITQQIGTILWFAFSTLVYAHREKLQSNLSRFVLTGDYIGYQTGSLSFRSIVNNLNFDDNRLKHYTSPEEYHEALSKGSKNGGVGAIVDEIPYLMAFLAKYPSQYAIIGSAPITNGFGFAFQKGSPLVPKLSTAIAKMREEGKLKHLEEKWFTNNYQSSFIPEATEESQLKMLNVDNLRGLFIGKKGCGFFDYADSPMCPRAISIISGLLKRINRDREEIEKLKVMRIEGKMRSGDIISHYLTIFIVVFGEYAVIVNDDRSVMEDNIIGVAGGGSYETMAGLDFYEFKKRRYDHTSFPRHVGDFCKHGQLLPLALTAGFNQFVALKHESETGAIDVSGFSVDVFREAMRVIQYHLECKFVLFVVANSSGQTAGSYTDLLKQLHLGRLDAVVGDTTITSDRFSLVDFTLPYTDPGVGKIQSPMDDYMGSQRGSSIQYGNAVDNINFHDNRLKHYNSPEEYHEALSKGSKNGGADAIIDEIPYLNAFLARYPSQYAIIGSETNTDGFGFAFRKGSPLVAEFSRAIAKLREEGRLKQLEEKWFKNNNPSSEEGGLNIYELRGLFVLSVIANASFLSRFLFFFIRKKLEVEGNVSATEVAPVMQSQIGKAHTNLIDSENPESASDQFEAANNQWRRLLETLLPSYADAVQSDQNQQAITFLTLATH